MNVNGILLFVFGLVLGIFVSPWLFLIALIPLVAAAIWPNE